MFFDIDLDDLEYEGNEKTKKRFANEIFGYRSITWAISSHFAVTCNENDLTIYSPEFFVRIPFETKWRLSIIVKQNECKLISVSLERLEHSPFPGDVKANYKLFFPVEEKKEVKEYTKTFSQNMAHVEPMYCNFQNLDCKILLTFKYLILQCDMVVYVEDDSFLELPRNDCLKSLSQDLSVLGRLGNNFDKELYYGSGETIRVHKAVLCWRNHVFRKILEVDKELIDLNYPHFNVSPVIDVVQFLYSGNLKYVMRTPSMGIGQAIQHYDVQELKEYYKCDTLRIETYFNARQFEFRVNNFNKISKGSTVFSHRMQADVNSNFRLALYLKKFDDKEYLNLEIRFIKGVLPDPTCVHFGILDARKLIRNVKCQLCSSDSDGQNITFEKFADKKLLKSSSLVSNGKIKLICRLHRTAVCTTIPVLERLPEITRVQRFGHMKNMANEMDALFSSNTYADCVIKSGAIEMQVNKAILSSRSHVLNKLFQEKVSDRYTSGIDGTVLWVIFRYLYGGVFSVHMLSYALKVFFYSKVMGVQALRNTCNRHLRDSCDKNDIVNHLLVADKQNDRYLKHAALSFIATNVSEFEGLEIWPTLIEKYHVLYREIVEFVGDPRMEIDIHPVL